ncbi:aldo/keto reductase [Streptomyces sp. NPDC001617]
MTLIDTADVYGPLTDEELVGRALKDRRDRAVLATKVGLLSRDSKGRPVRGPNGRPEHVRLSIDESLARLGTDHVAPCRTAGSRASPTPEGGRD